MASMDRPRSEALTPVEVAELLRITKNTVYELIKRGELHGYRVGRKVRVDLKDVEAYKQRDRPSVARAVSNEESDAPPRGSLVIAGQDLMLDVLVQQVERAYLDFRVLRSYLGSYNGLFALYQEQVDLATAHLWDAETGSYNVPFVNRMLPGIPAFLIRLARRPVGFYVKKGNPRGISGWTDLSRADVVMANRELGSGMRVLIDQKLQLMGLDSANVAGYGAIAGSHLAAAAAVARGDADVAVGNEKAAAQVPGVDFLFLHDEQLDMVIKSSMRMNPAVNRILAVLRSPEYRSEIECLGGYDLRGLGQEVEQG
jgi:putative molybdopterin biosynthesis protein